MDKQCILLVEDNADNELLTLRAFKKNNITNNVVVARDGEQALDFLFARGQYADRDIHDLPQLVLLDLKLPRINGLEVLKQVRDNPDTRCLPVVILTSSDEEQDITASYNAGANSYIRKPVDFEKFNEAVHQLGSYWLVLNVAPRYSSAS